MADLTTAGLADDFAVFDGLEQVTVQPRSGVDAWDSAGWIDGIQALRRVVEVWHPDAAGLRYPERTTVFHLPRQEGLERVNPGDRILDADGVTWLVTRADWQTLLARWRVEVT